MKEIKAFFNESGATPNRTETPSLDVAEATLGPDIAPPHTKRLQKPPEIGALFPTVHDTTIAGVLPLFKASEEMRCLRVYPGTHKLGRPKGHDGQRPRPRPLSPRRGDVVHRCTGEVDSFTIPGSAPNRTQKTRKTFLVPMHAGSDEAEKENRHVNSRLALCGRNERAKRSLGNVAG